MIIEDTGEVASFAVDDAYVYWVVLDAYPNASETDLECERDSLKRVPLVGGAAAEMLRICIWAPTVFTSGEHDLYFHAHSFTQCFSQVWTAMVSKADAYLTRRSIPVKTIAARVHIPARGPVCLVRARY